MFKTPPAKLSLVLLLAVFLLPVGRLHAQTTGSDPQTNVIGGTDPEPTGEPKPKAIGTDSDPNGVLFQEFVMAMLAALQVS